MELCYESCWTSRASKSITHAMQAVLIAGLAAVELLKAEQGVQELARATACAGLEAGELTALVFASALEIGRASCRERVCCKV